MKKSIYLLSLIVLFALGLETAQAQQADAGPDQVVCNSEAMMSAFVPDMGSGQWSFVAGQGIIDDPTNPNALVYDLAPGLNVLVWEVTDGMNLSFDSVEIINGDPGFIDAGGDQFLCEDFTTLDAVPPMQGTGQWKFIQGSGLIANVNDAKTTVDDLAPGANLLAWTVATPEGCQAHSAVRIQNDGVMADAGPNQTICNNKTQLSAAVMSATGTGYWEAVQGWGNIMNPDMPTTEVTDLDYGTNIFRWAYVNGVCSSEDEVIVVNNMPSPADAGPDMVICGPKTELYAADPFVGVGHWELTGTSPAVIVDADAPITMVENLRKGKNTLQWVVVNGNCISKDEIVIKNMKPVADAGDDQEVCGQVAELSAAPLPSTATGEWMTLFDPVTGTGSSGWFEDFTLPFTKVQDLEPGENVLIWKVYQDGCEAHDTVVITANAISADVAPGETICTNYSTLMAKPVPDATGHWSIISGGAKILNSASNVTPVEELWVGKNTFRWTITNGACTDYEDVIIVSLGDSNLLANAGVDMEVCGETAMLDASPAPTGGVGHWEFISEPAMLNDPGKPNARVNGLHPGLNVLRWLVEMPNGCKVYDDVVVQNKQPMIDAGPDQMVCEPHTRVKAIDYSGAGTTINWTSTNPSVELGSSNSLETEVTNLSQGINRLVISAVNAGCTAKDTIVITYNNLMVDAGVDLSICADSAQLMASTPPAGATGYWMLEDNFNGGGTTAWLENADMQTTWVHNLPPGETKIRWEVEKDGCWASDLVIVTNNAVEAYAGEDITICGNEFFLQANDIIFGTGTWTSDQPSVIFDDPHSPFTNVTNLQAGTNQLYWNTENGSCSDVDGITILSNTPNATISTDSVTICDDTYSLTANTPLGGETGQWYFVKGYGDIVNEVSNTTDVYSLMSGENKIVWEVIDSEGCMAADTLRIYSNQLMATSYTATTVCKPEVRLEAQMANSGLTGVAGSWTTTTTGVIIDNPSNSKTMAYNLQAGVNQFTWTVSKGGCMASMPVEVINDAPSPAVITSPNTEVCGTSPVTVSAQTPIIGTGYWETIEGYAMFDNPNNNNTMASGFFPGKNVLRWSVENMGCISSDITTVQNNSAMTNAGIDETVCADSAFLKAEPLPKGATGLWTKMTGGAIIVNPTSHFTPVVALDMGSNMFTWTVNNGSCMGSDDVMINSSNVMTIGAHAGPDQTVCYGATPTLSANPPGAFIGTWEVVEGAAVLDNYNDNNATVVSADHGKVVLKWSIYDDSNLCNANDFVSINVEKAGIANAGIDKIVCTDSVLLYATRPNEGETGHWTQTAGTGTIQNINNRTTMVNNLSSGINRFKWTITTPNGCLSFDEVTITNNGFDVTANAASPVVCDGSVAINGSPSAIGADMAYWENLTGSGNILTPNTATTSVSDLSPGINAFEWYVEKNGCSGSDTVIVKNKQLPDATTINDLIVCEDSAVLIAAQPPMGTGQWSALNGAVTIDNANNFQTPVRNLSDGTNTFKWKVTYIEDGVTCNTEKTVIIYNRRFNVSAGSNMSVCDPAEVSLSATNIINGSGYWEIVNGYVDLSDYNSPNPDVYYLEPGENILRWQGEDQGCWASAEVTINYHEVIAEVGPDRTICGKEDYLMANPLMGTATGLWTTTGPAIIHQPDRFSTKVSSLAPGANAFTWKVSSGSCHAEKTIVITSDPVNANAGPDLRVDDPNGIVLNAVDPPAGYDGEWWIMSGYGDFTDMTDPKTTLKDIGYGANIFHWVVTSPNGCMAHDDVEIIYDGIFVEAGPDRHICSDSAVVYLKGIKPNAGTGVWSVVGGSADIDNPNFANTTITNFSEGTTTLLWTVNYNGQVYQDELNVHYIPMDVDFDVSVDGLTVDVTPLGNATWVSGYSWNFGDLNTYTASAPSHTFDKPGVYEICASVLNTETACLNQFCKPVKVGTLDCFADFTYSVNPDTKKVDFTSISDGSPDRLTWTFGNGKTGKGATVSHTYTQNGVYDIELQIENTTSGCKDMTYKMIHVGQSDCGIIPEFAFFVDEVAGKPVVTFLNESYGENDINWVFSWDFGNGATSTKENVERGFAKDGLYKVTLAVRDTIKKCEAQITKHIQIGSVDCAARFTYFSDPTTKEVKFINESVGNITESFWRFGDNNGYSYKETPSYTYLKTGMYPVRLSIATSDGCEDAIELPVLVGDAECNAEFTAFVDSVSQAAFFKPEIIGNVSSYQWNFGDGKTATQAAPIHFYPQPGMYTVELRIHDDSNGCHDSYSKTIVVGSQGIDVQAEFDYVPVAGTREIDFIDQSYGHVSHYIWNFGDGSMPVKDAKVSHTYTKNGVYLACQTVVSPNPLISSTKCYPVHVDDGTGGLVMAYFDYVVDVPNKTALFKDLSFGPVSKKSWAFGDGNILENPSELEFDHVYNKEGLYFVQFRVESTNSASRYVSFVNVSNDDPGHVCQYVADVGDPIDNLKVTGYPVDFVGTSFGNPAKFVWEFGDGKQDSTTLSPQHVYQEPGTYDVCFKAIDPVTEDTTTYCDQVVIEGTGIDQISADSKLALVNYPNPFSEQTTIAFTLPQACHIDLSIYDMVGNKVATVLNEKRQAGIYRLPFNSQYLNDGMYYLRLKTDQGVVTQSMMISR